MNLFIHSSYVPTVST